MGSHPVNLGLRFLLELAALAAMIYWGWTQHEGILRVVLAIGVPLAAATVWGVFRVPGDLGDAVVAIPGWLRLPLELVFFAAATLLLFSADQSSAGTVFGMVVVLHYLASYDRILWLLRGH